MNSFHFEGRLTSAPTLQNIGPDKHVCRFTLIRNEYAGEDREERQVAIQFTCFGKRGVAIAQHAGKGDQLILTARIENNNYSKDGHEVYGFNFVVQNVIFGARSKANQDAYNASRQSDADTDTTSDDIPY